MNIEKLSIELLSTSGTDELALTLLVGLINDVYAVAEADFWQSNYLRTTENQVIKSIENSEIIVAKYEGVIIASVNVQSIGGRVSKFGMLAVPPKYERNGIGGRLVSAAEAHALANGSSKMRLEILTPVEGKHRGKQVLGEWYLRLGYRFIKQFPFEKHVPEEAKFLKMPCYFNIYDKELSS
ncbi:MAG: GNAT family N-acetyltransferase [Flavobacteriales bacterium]|nr:GNAT family N-acetyltransferase [Flavobacteriales bacterium]